ncbi:resuscitation-promoting factor [Cellulomonas chengniuliangii]|uniref:Transglycosylase family protein n=1 Tax=Cellulomonas chengniuliangii TaxID=2968084 RepID=A0ABY5KZU4_9CELL|nr:resuscitation-promoting factor [Cellulomonas chengniuliangii]MCC2307152.1 transglycosylase family protein [Cellulomonas chengniuliangii]MCC2317951.1 transglycosylase family protein [Cellulomonas chengniuliangii]UUI76051.1 transglycosylase family protein [Cellulomonas chengniuliangii]
MTAVLLVGSGATVASAAHKTVSLDIDGETTSVTTWSGSVHGLLDENDVEVTDRDLVAPVGKLEDGAEIVVRHARLIDVQTDGSAESVWTTALTADEALAAFASRGGDVRLVASRSAADGRPELALELTLDGPADVVVDGQTHTVDDGSTTVGEALEHLGVTLGELDTVTVARSPETGRVSVVVSRVLVQEVATTSEVAFATVTQDDPSRYVGQKAVVTRGVTGVRTVLDRVTTVDGVETARETLSDTVTQAPVDEVVKVGAKQRPAATAASGGAISAGGAADSLNWAALAQCESGGNASIVSSTGKYHGLYQFSVATWQAVGGAGVPSQASADEQTARAKMLYNRSGAGQWPHCGSRLFG